MNRAKIADKIAKLRALSQRNGASEAEAMEAMRKAAALAAQFEIEEAEIAAAGGKRGFVFETVARRASAGDGSKAKRRQRHRATDCCHLIATLFECKYIFPLTADHADPDVEFVGDSVDCEAAAYTFEVIRSAMDREYRVFQRGVWGASRRTFQMAMASRINERLRGMIHERGKARAERVATHGNLPVLVEQKRDAVTAKFKELWPKVRYTQRPTKGFATGSDSAAAGRRAGDRVHLGRGIGRSSTGGLLG